MKKGLLIGTLAAAALLVGGTFAAYFVNDQAAAKSATIKIADLVSDYVTLEWGADDLADVNELHGGESQKVGNVTVKGYGKDKDGNPVDAEHPYVGYLELTLNNDLKGHLSVFAKEVVGEEEKEIEGTPANGGIRYSASVYEGGDKEFAIYVRLDSVSEIGEDMAEVTSGQATLSIDWKPGPESDAYEPVVPVPTVEYYLAGTMNEWKEAAAYKFALSEYKKGEGEGAKDQYILENVALEANDEIKVKEGDNWYPSEGGNYVVTEGANYNVWFVPEGGVEEDGWFGGYFYLQKLGEAPQDPQEPEPQPTTIYFMTGKVNGGEVDWDPVYTETKVLLGEPKEAEAKDNVAVAYDVELKAGDEFKVVEATGEAFAWHGKGEANVTVESDGTYTVGLSKDGDVYVW